MNASSRVLGTDVSVESKYILDSKNQTAVTVDAFPCGIDCAKFEKMLDSSELKDKATSSTATSGHLRPPPATSGHLRHLRLLRHLRHLR